MNIALLNSKTLEIISLLWYKLKRGILLYKNTLKKDLLMIINSF